MASWYVHDVSTGSPWGPYTRGQLELMVADGRVRADTRVASVGSTEWVAASSDLALAALFTRTPPTSPDAIRPIAPAPVARGAYRRGAAFMLAWRSFTSEWPKWFVLGFAWPALSVALWLPLWLAEHAGTSLLQDAGAGVRLAIGGGLAMLIQIFAGAPLLSGLLYAAAQIHDGEGRFGDIFQGFRRYRAALVTGLYLLGIVVLSALVASVPVALTSLALSNARGSGASADIAAAIGIIASFATVLTLVITVFGRLTHAAGLVVDPKFGVLRPKEALRMSWENTRGIAGSMFTLFMWGVLLLVLSMAGCGIGAIVVGTPLLCSILGAMYVLIQRGRLAAPPGA